MAPNETISKQLSTDTPFDIRTGCTRIRSTPRPSRDLARIFLFHLSRTSNVCEIVEKKKKRYRTFLKFLEITMFRNVGRIDV